MSSVTLTLSSPRKDKDNYSPLNFSLKSLDIFTICSPSSGGQEVTKRKRTQKRVRIERRIVADQVRSLMHIYSRQTRSPDSNPVSSLTKIEPPGAARCGRNSSSYQMRPNINQINKASLGESASSFQSSGKTRIYELLFQTARIVTRRDKDNHSLLNFSPKGLKNFAICSPSSGGQEVTKRKRVQKKMRIKRRILPLTHPCGSGKKLNVHLYIFGLLDSKSRL